MAHGRASTCRSTFENAKASKNSLNPELHLKKGVFGSLNSQLALEAGRVAVTWVLPAVLISEDFPARYGRFKRNIQSADGL